MAECLLVLEDGSGFLVFEDGSGDLLLEACISGCGYELEGGGGVILLESGDELLREDCGTAVVPLSGGWVEEWPVVDDDDADVITLTLMLSRRRRRLRVA